MKDHYAERPRDRRVERCRLAEGSLSGDESAVGINEEHGEDFLNQVIPSIIKRVRDQGSKRKVRILDSGCGLGFFTDQIRQKFGEEVAVYGTSIENPVQPEVSANQKKSYIDFIKQHAEELPPGVELDKLKDTIHPNDAQFRSIVEMRQFPEFDLIIDTSGEFLYSGKGFMPMDSYFDLVLKAALQKLGSKGELYVSRVHPRDYATIQRFKEKNPQFQVEIGDKGEHKTAFVIRKKE
ncbi:MAG: hypothetical protein AAB558_03620 [Patescibacteria group bacterium]